MGYMIRIKAVPLVSNTIASPFQNFMHQSFPSVLPSSEKSHRLRLGGLSVSFQACSSGHLLDVNAISSG